jgi:hypothetical protein
MVDQCQSSFLAPLLGRKQTEAEREKEEKAGKRIMIIL